MNTTLVIMAAGMGSRYGGIKQLEAVGPGGEIIMDYSIHDAVEAGFNKVVVILRKDILKDFKEVIGDRIEQKVQVEYVFQELSDLPAAFTLPEGRVKPWGTGHAILTCRDVVKEPFAVINADDYYGKEGFKKIHEFLSAKQDQTAYCMAGFVLGNTLSENGTVTRGVCKADADDMLTDIVETSGIMAKGNVAVAKDGDGNDIEIPLNSIVSMNMWGFQPSLLKELETGFTAFLSNMTGNELTKEYLLPTIVGDMVNDKKATVKVLKTDDKWFGVTYKEDKEAVVKSIRELVEQGIYPAKLYQ